MKIVKINIIVAVLLMVAQIFLMCPKKSKTKKVNKLFEERAYVDVKTSYEELLENSYTSEETFKNLGIY